MGSLGDLSLLEKKDTRLVVISRAPLAKLEAYKSGEGLEHRVAFFVRQRFQLRLSRHAGPEVAPQEYNYRNKAETEAAVGHPVKMQGESPGLSVFFRLDGDIFHTYSTYARGGEALVDSYRLLDVTPYGRQQEFEDSPPGWPQQPTYD